MKNKIKSLPASVNDKVCIYKPNIIYNTQKFSIIYILNKFNNIFAINITTNIKYIKNDFLLNIFLVFSLFNGLFSEGTGHFLYKIKNE